MKDICLNVLHVDNANDMLFDRAHRVGQKSATARPIVVKFHYYTDRSKVRQASFTYSDDLKTAQFGVGAQLPKGIRDARKPLYPAIKKAKDEGKNVKFVGKNYLSTERSTSQRCRWSSRDVMKSRRYVSYRGTLTDLSAK